VGSITIRRTRNKQTFIKRKKKRCNKRRGKKERGRRKRNKEKS
jgi:hypothetical protein